MLIEISLNYDYNILDGFSLNINDPYNNPAIRNATQDYLNGQQTNTIPNLTQDAIQQAQQTQQGGSGGGDTQQGGSGSGDTQQGGSGGTPTLQGGVYIVGGEQNLQERLNYLNQAMAEQAETNLEGFLAIFNDEPMKSILENGKNSPYLSELDEEDADMIAKFIQKAYQGARNVQYLKNNNYISSEDSKQIVLNLFQTVNNGFDVVSKIPAICDKYKYLGIGTKMGIIGAIAGAVASFESWVLADSDLKKRYPNAYEDAWKEVANGVPSFSNQLNISNRLKVASNVRNIDPDRYDKRALATIDMLNGAVGAGLLIGMGVCVLASTTAVAAAPVAILGLAITAGVAVVSSFEKAVYLTAARPEEYPLSSFLATFGEQILGVGFGGPFEGVKNLFKGNKNPSSSQNVVEPNSGTSPKKLLKSAIPLTIDVTDSAVIYGLKNTAAQTGLVFSGSEGNDTLFNVEDNYLINAGNGDDQISNVGDRVTVDAGNGNDYVANLGDNVLIISGVGNNVIDNSGANVIMNFADGDNYVGNVGDYVTVTAGNGNNYVDNVGNFANIRLGNGANDVENFGSNVIVNTGSGVDFIVNYGLNTTINAGSGKDVVFNSYGSNVLINTDQDDDYISVKESSECVTVNSGSGSDVVINNGTNSFINLGSENDYAYNDSLGSGTTITGLDGDDTLENRAANVSINGGSGNNRFVNDGVAVTMISGEGADVIANAGNAAVINAGNGDNSLGNAGDTVSISTGIGNDIIINEGNSVTISVAGGNNGITNKGSANSIIIDSGHNTIQNYGESANIKSGPNSDIVMSYDNSNIIMNGAINTTIISGAGKDTIINYFAMQADDNGNFTKVLYNGNNVLINSGTDNDLIENYGSFGTITGGAGDDTIKNFGVLLIDQNGDTIRTAPVSNYYYQIDAGRGNNFVYNENANATITSGTGADLIENVADTVNINAGDGDNTIANLGSTVTIQSGAGNDSIESDDSNVTISAGAGNDFIHNYSNGYNSSLNGGEGADTIENDAQNVTIDAGVGNDHIANAGSNTTIHAGRGDDTIVLDASAQNNVIKYRAGDGNKIIYGCNSTTIIKISGADFNITENVSDKIIKVDDGTITLKNVANVSGLNIIREDETDAKFIKGTEGADSINNSLNSAAIAGLGGADSITNSGANVLIDGGDGHDKISNGGKNSTVNGGAGNDTIYNGSDNVTIDGGEGDDTIENYGEYSTVDGGNGDDYITNYGEGATLRGGEGADSIINQDNNVFISGGNGNDFIGNGTDGKYSYGARHNVTIDAGEGNDTIYSDGANVSINAGNGNDNIANYIYYGVTINAGADNDTITNSGASVSIDAGNGDDYISNSGSYVTIKGGKGNDTLDGVGSETILFGTGDGSDIINNYKSKNLIKLTSGKILNTLLSGEDIILSLGSDSLTLKNAKYKLVRIDNVDGTQTIINKERIGQTISNALSNQTLTGGPGNDSIYNTGNNVTIKGGEGDDSVTNRGANVLIDGHADNNFIQNNKFIEWNDNAYKWVTSSISPDNVTILGGEDDDRILNYGGQRISIDGGKGDDYIINDTEPEVYKSERIDHDYEEIVYPTPDYATLLGGDGNDSIENYGANSIIDGGDGNDDIENYGNYSTINASIGDDKIYNGRGNNALINGDEGSDYIRNSGNNSTVNGGQGSDSIENNSDNLFPASPNVLINGDEGDDFLGNRISLNISINGGSGNDTIENYGGTNALLNGGDGDDLISNKTGYSAYNTILSDNVTIDAGAGNDTIINEGNNALFICSGGFDSIVGFNETSSLQIGNGETDTYSKDTVGTDILVSVGSEVITLSGATSLSNINILGNEKPHWSFNGAIAKCGNLFTISNVKNTDSIIVNHSNKTVTLSANNLNGENVTISDGYTLALDGVTAPITTKAQWYGTTYKSEYISAAGYEASGNKITYTPATNPTELFSLSGIDSANGFNVSKNGDSYIVNISNLSYDASKTITLDKKSSNVHFAYADNFAGNKVQTIAQAASLNNGIYTSTTYQAWSELDDDALTIHPATTAKTFTISGLGNGAELGTNVIISENKITINDGALNSTHEKISVSDPSYTLEVTASPVKAINFAQNGNKVTLSGTTAGYKEVNGEYVWQEQIGGESLTITGLKSGAALTADMFTRNGNVITFKPTQDLLPDEPTTITISSGEIDTSALSTTGAVDAHWSGTTYVSAKTASSWTTGTSGVSYTPAAGGEELFKIDGLKSVNGITPTQNGNNYKITLLATAFDKSGTITVTKKNAAATLEFEGIGTTAEPVDATLTKGGVYKTVHTSEHFATSTSGDTTTYTYTTAANDYGFTISGLNLSNDISGTTIDEYLTFNNGTITVKKLGTNDITLSNIDADGDNDGSTDITIKLALEKDVVQVAHTFNTGVALIKSGNDYVYTSAGYKPWYELSDTKITYHPATGGESLFTISGLGTATLGENIIVDGTTVKVSGSALAQKNVSITGDYTLTLNNVSAPLPSAAHFDGLTYKSESTTGGYTLNNNQIIYTPEVKSTNLFTLTGVKDTSGVNLNNKTVTISAKSLNGKAVTLNGDFTLALASNVAKPSTTKASWTNKSGTYTYTAAKTSAGYFIANNKISYAAATGGQQFSITGLKNTSAVTISGKKVTIGNASLNGKAVTISSGYTLALASNVAKPTTTAAKWTSKSGTYTYTAAGTSAGYSLASNKISYAAASGGQQFSITGLKNTSAVTVSGKKVTIGNASLNGKAVTLTGDFTLALAKDVATSAKKTAGAFSTVSKGTATYKTTSFNAYYKLSGKKISYTAATGGQAITLKNLNTSANLAAVKKGITVAEQSNGSYKITFQNAGVLTTKAPTVSAAKGVKYTVAVADSLKPVTKAAAWNISGTTAIFRSDTTAGYTVNSKNAVVYTAQKNGSPLVELTNLAKNVKANAITTKGKVVTLNASVLGTKTAIKSNNGGYSFSLTGNMSGKKFTGTSKVDTLTVAANNANVDAGAGNDVVTVSGLKVTLNGGAGNETITVTGKNNIIYGGAGVDTIVSKNSGNTLVGGSGDDQLWGSTKFADVFVYNKGDGHETIRFFDKNDLLQITGTNAITGTYNSSKKEIYFSVASTDKAITLTDFGKTTTFHVNNDTYQISGTKLIKK